MSKIRKSGIDVLGEIPWGSHFCSFYETKLDLLDTLVPYFKAGLESKEFCMWVVSNSDLITVEEAKQALEQAVPNLNRHISEGNIEIFKENDWYLKENKFNLERMSKAWDTKLKRALALGYEGMRVSGDTFWLEENDWKDFTAYEKQLNDSIIGKLMTVLCTYPMSKSGATEILDVVQAHQFAITRRQGEWEVIETPELIQAKAEIKKLNEELEQRVAERTKELASANIELRREIAERKQAEDALRKSEDRIQLIIDTIPIMAWSVRPDGTVDFFNQRGLDYTGLSLEQYIKDPTGPIHPEDITRVMEKWPSKMADGKAYEDEMRFRRPDGEYRWFLIRSAPLHDEKGNLIKWYGVSIDIEDSKRAEDELRLAYQRLSYHVENTPLAVIEFDKDLFIKRWSKRAEEIFGWKESEALGKNVHDPDFPIIYKEDIPKVDKINEQLMTGTVTSNLSLNRNYTKDGNIIYCEWYNSVLRDEQGNVITILSLAHNVTEKKIAEEQIKKSEAHLAEAQRLAKLGSWDYDIEADRLTWSDELYNVFGTDKRTFRETHSSFLHLIDEKDRKFALQTSKHTQQTGEPFTIEYHITTPNGEKWVIQEHGYGQIDDNGKVVRLFGTAQDITERKKAEETLQQSYKEIRRLTEHLQKIREEERVTIAREIHDELGQQLTALTMEAKGLNKKLNDADEGIKQEVVDIIDLLDTMVKSVRRISSELRPSLLYNLGLVAAIEWHLKEFEKRSGIKTIFTEPKEELEMSDSIKNGLFRIFQESLTNVSRHANADNVNVTLEQKDQQLILSIEDNGKGFEKENIATKDTLGILGMRERSQMMGGNYEIISIPGKGTTVIVAVPYKWRK